MSGIALNEDSSHFYLSRTVDEMTVEGLKGLVDNYSSPQMKELIFNPNAQRTSFPSKVWTTVWKDYQPGKGKDQPLFQNHLKGDSCFEGMDGLLRWVDNTHTLYKKGLDPYEVWLEYTRQRGMQAWISMRMNDIHDVHNPNSVLHSDFWRAHPEYRRVTYRFEEWSDRALDFGRKEVRDYHMALVREYFERYDMDGFELDWMRFGWHFRPGHELEGGERLTEFMAEVRGLANQAAERLGHPIRIGVRVPTRPRTARLMGMDAVEWARRDLVDMIVVTPFFATTEFDIPIELWKELLGDRPIVLAAGLEILMMPYPDAWAAGRVTNTSETVRGAAVSFLHRGADRIYLFNYMDAGNSGLGGNEFEPERREIMTQIGEIATMTKLPRRHVVTYADTWAMGDPTPLALPAECRKGRTPAFRVHTGPRPTTGKAYVFFGVAEAGTVRGEDFYVYVNAEPCSLSATNSPGKVHPVVKATFGFEIPLSALNEGYNVIEIGRTLEQAVKIVWVEIKIVPAD